MQISQREPPREVFEWQYGVVVFKIVALSRTTQSGVAPRITNDIDRFSKIEVVGNIFTKILNYLVRMRPYKLLKDLPTVKS